jgi:hypothetical protein
MKLILLPALATLITLSGCGDRKADDEVSPGAASRYLDNISAHEPTATTNASHASGETSPASGNPDPSSGQAPIYSRQPVAPRQ